MTSPAALSSSVSKFVVTTEVRFSRSRDKRTIVRCWLRFGRSGTASSSETVRVTAYGSDSRRLNDPKTSSKRPSLNALSSESVLSTPKASYVLSTKCLKSGICGALTPVPHRNTTSPDKSESTKAFGNSGPSVEKQRDTFHLPYRVSGCAGTAVAANPVVPKGFMLNGKQTLTIAVG